MNKKLLVAAIGAAIAAGPMMAAQAEVKLYGHAHMSLDNLDRDVSGDPGEWFVSDNASRFGIRASEDLGGGLKGVAQYEFLLGRVSGTDSVTQNAQGFDRATGNLVTNRDNYVGLEGGFGRIVYGQIDSASKDVGGIADFFYREQLGEGRAITNVDGGMDRRIQSGIHYLSPDFGGVTFKLQYGVEDNFANDLTEMSANVRYTAGPLSAGVSYLNSENCTLVALTQVCTASLEDTTGYRLAAKYDVGGGFTVAGLWQSVSDIGGVSGRDRDVLGLGASFKSGNNIFKAQWIQADATDDAAVDNGADQLSIGWDHLFSKTVKGYITYAKTSNDDAGTFGIGGNGHGELATPPAGGDASGFSVGTIIDF